MKEKEANNKAKTNTNTKTDAEAKSKPRTNAKSKPKADAEAKAKPRTNAKSKPKTDAEAKSKPRTNAKSKPKTDTEAKSKPRTNAKSKPKTDAEAKSKPRTNAKSKPKTDTEAKSKPKTAAEANSKANYSIVMGICFAAILAFFFIANVLVPDKDFSEQENRSLQTFPDFSIAEYTSGRFESKLENYANDQFIARNAFIKLKTASSVSAGSVYSNGVWKGKGGYLIEDAVDPSKELIEKDIAAISAFKAKHANIPMRMLLAPTAVNVYADKLPIFAQPADQNKYMDELFAGISEAGVQVVDVRETFEAEKDKTQLYYRTDHHWTSEGAGIAFNKLAADIGLGQKSYKLYEVKDDFIGSLASKSGFVGGKADVMKLTMPENGLKSAIYYYDTQEKTTAFYKLKNLNKKDAYTVFGGNNHPLYTIKTPTSENRRLLLIKDSYANSMIPYLAQHYREIVVVDPRYYYDDLEDLILSEQVNEVLFLYNANTFFGDESLALMLSEA